MTTHTNTSTHATTTPCLARRFTHVRSIDTVNIWQCDVCGASVRITLDMRGDLWRHYCISEVQRDLKLQEIDLSYDETRTVLQNVRDRHDAGAIADFNER